MQLEIKTQEKKPLLMREEINATATFKGATPSRAEIKKEIASKIKKEENLIIVKSIKKVYGQQQSEVEAHIYNNEKDLKEIEDEVTLKRNNPKAKEESKKKEESK